MSPEVRGPVVIDTGVFAARLTPSGNLLAARYAPSLRAGLPSSPSSPWPSSVTVPDWLGGARDGFGGWITR